MTIRWTRNANGTGTVTTDEVAGVQPAASAPTAVITLREGAGRRSSYGIGERRPVTSTMLAQQGLHPSLLERDPEYVPGPQVSRSACECPAGIPCHCTATSEDLPD